MWRHNNDSKMKTGRMWVNLLSRILTHLVIVLCVVFAVLLGCDLFLKGEMSFIVNPLAKMLLFVLCAVAFANSFIQLSCLNKLRSLRKYMKLKAKRR